MSTKKDKFTKKDHYFMNLAITLARSQKSIVGPNPSVGCIIVKKSKVRSFGLTNSTGRPHAETIALKRNKFTSKGSTVYTTLEPCSHYGKTPPCTNALIKAKVNKVIYSVKDHDKRSFDKSQKILKSKKIKSKTGLLSKNVNNFYKIYNYIKENNLPYVTGKIACSSNFYILRNNTKITNEHSQKISHLLRYKNQGILTSYKTINTDNPNLNCRISGLEKFSPSIIIIDKSLKINLKSYVLNKPSKINVIIFYNCKKLKKIDILKKKGIKLIKFNTNLKNYFDLKKLFMKIYSIGIHTLLVECGKDLTYKMISERLFNEFYLFKSNKILLNNNKVSIFKISNTLKQNFKHKKLINTYLDKDRLIHYS